MSVDGKGWREEAEWIWKDGAWTVEGVDGRCGLDGRGRP